MTTPTNAATPFPSRSLPTRPGAVGLPYPGPTDAGRPRPLDPARAESLGHALDDTLAALACDGVEEVFAPMASSTWGAYRLRIDGTDLSPRAKTPLLETLAWEPPRDPVLASLLMERGFSIVKTYHSQIFDTTLFPWDHPIPRRSASKAESLGLRVVPLLPLLARAPAIVSELHAVTLAAFSGNFLFEPLGLQDFLSLYKIDAASIATAAAELDPSPSRALIDGHGRLRGYVYAFFQGDTAVVKTICVHPDVAARYGTGLWSASYALLASVHARVRERGPRWYVSALVADEASSRHMAGLHARALAGVHEYALFGARLRRTPLEGPPPVHSEAFLSPCSPPTSEVAP